MRRFALAALLAAAPLLAPAYTLAQDTPPAPAAEAAQQGRLTVTGSGGVDSVPDMAVITMGVTAQAETAAAAMEQTSAGTAEVLARLEEAGIAPRDMQTSDLSLNPVWNDRAGPGERQITGYEARNTVTVRVRALEELGGILDTVVQSGANTFNGLSFALQDPLPALDEARRRAVADARRKAELYAEAAGVTLGPLLELSESVDSPGPVMFRAAAMEAAPVAEGEVSTETSVRMVYAIGE
jgi:hypothetical protein